MATKASGLALDVAHDFAGALGQQEDAHAVVTSEEWDTLLSSSSSDVVFLTWQWQSVWWKHFGAQEGCKLHLLVLREDGGALTGIAPLFIAPAPIPPVKEYKSGELRPEGTGSPKRLVRFVGGTEVADYLDIIASRDRMKEVWSAVLDYLAERQDEWDALDLHCLPEWSSSREIVRQLASDLGLNVQVYPEDVCPVLPLPNDWLTYLMSLRKKDRHELRRKVRKLEGRDDVGWYIVPPTDAEAMREGMAAFIALHRKSGPDKARFMDERMAAFFSDMASTLLNTGWLDLAMLDIDRQHAAAYFSFNYKRHIYLYNSGYDPKFGSYSAGIALLAYRIHKAINQGCQCFDFLRGDEPYKYDFGAKNTFVYRALGVRRKT